MNMRRVLIVLVLGCAILTSPVFGQSGGGGGMYLGYQTSSYPFLEQYPVVNNSLDLIYYGGYGYGVSYRGSIAGGFGAAVMDVAGGSGIAGGIGGFITGGRLISSPVNISIMSWTGFGGISTGVLRIGDRAGFAIFFQELTLELGLPIVAWFMPTLFAGYQIAGNIAPEIPFEAFFSYTPVIGFRLQWGDFR